MWRRRRSCSVGLSRFLPRAITKVTGLLLVLTAVGCAPHGVQELRTSDDLVDGGSSRVATFSYVDASFRHNNVFGQGFYTYLQSLDGISVPNYSGPQYFAVEPGRHSAIVRIEIDYLFSDSRIESAREITFETNDAMHYAILSFVESSSGAVNEVFVWVHEIETNAVVAGNAPLGFRYACQITSNGAFADCSEQ